MTEQFLDATYFLDHDDPAISDFAAESTAGADGEIDRACRLFYAVRDGIRYDPYNVEITRPGLRASYCLKNGYGFCVTKAALLVASARSLDIPARPGFADVRNHLTSPRLRKLMNGSDVFVHHGYAELKLEGRWVKATPTFDQRLCDKAGIGSLDFDGRQDAMFHPFDLSGQQHMEYLRDHGPRPDVPYDEIMESWLGEYGHVFEPDRMQGTGDFAEEAEAGS
ncbi:MAG: transglutaminase family protein [Alphaproteobacteria bacterium]|jgi:transglutaminase-like putative cysteine protease|nr:transglutaminase family protein [Alphaproteobacteria bacterium]HJP21556.1 transglutaminase family protein [Alphaproteobacteria bacterium]